MVKRGATIIGINCEGGVVLAAMEKKGGELVDPKFSWKIFEIDLHIGAAVSGLSSDAQKLVDQARIYSQSNRLIYDEPIDTEIVAKRIGSQMQLYTQHAGVRPYGVSIIFGGIDKSGSRLFATDPSGSYRGYLAASIGVGSDKAREILKKKHRFDMSLEDALKLAMECLKTTETGKKLEPSDMDVAVVEATTKRYRKLSEEEVSKYLQ